MGTRRTAHLPRGGGHHQLDGLCHAGAKVVGESGLLVRAAHDGCAKRNPGLGLDPAEDHLHEVRGAPGLILEVMGDGTRAEQGRRDTGREDLEREGRTWPFLPVSGS